MGISALADGEMGWGAVIVTPAIGPATVGLSGFELLDAWHPAARKAPKAAADRSLLRIQYTRLKREIRHEALSDGRAPGDRARRVVARNGRYTTWRLSREVCQT